jgi:hypothetical protein
VDVPREQYDGRRIIRLAGGVPAAVVEGAVDPMPLKQFEEYVALAEQAHGHMRGRS